MCDVWRCAQIAHRRGARRRREQAFTRSDELVGWRSGGVLCATTLSSVWLCSYKARQSSSNTACADRRWKVGNDKSSSLRQRSLEMSIAKAVDGARANQSGLWLCSEQVSRAGGTRCAGTVDGGSTVPFGDSVRCNGGEIAVEFGWSYAGSEQRAARSPSETSCCDDGEIRRELMLTDVRIDLACRAVVGLAAREGKCRAENNCRTSTAVMTGRARSERWMRYRWSDEEDVRSRRGLWARR